MTLSNPAGRLYALLTDFNAHAEGGKSIVDVWSEVLQPRGDVLSELAKVASLLAQIDEAVERSRDQYQRQAFDHYAPLWARALFAPEVNMTQTNPSPTMGLVDPGSLVSLGAIGGFLDATAAEGKIPDADTLQSLKSECAAMLEEIGNATDLSPDVHKLLLDHLHAFAWALDDLRLGGPGAVKAASERLIGYIAINLPRERRADERIARLVTFAGATYVAFTSGPAIQASIEAWNNLAGMLH